MSTRHVRKNTAETGHLGVLRERIHHADHLQTPERAAECCSELLILPDGRVLARNLTPAVAVVLRESLE